MKRFFLISEQTFYLFLHKNAQHSFAQSIRQKSSTVCASGFCVAMYARQDLWWKNKNIVVASKMMRFTIDFIVRAFHMGQ
jgi:hypothetical protein